MAANDQSAAEIRPTERDTDRLYQGDEQYDLSDDDAGGQAAGDARGLGSDSEAAAAAAAATATADEEFDVEDIDVAGADNAQRDTMIDLASEEEFGADDQDHGAMLDTSIDQHGSTAVRGMEAGGEITNGRDGGLGEVDEGMVELQIGTVRSRIAPLTWVLAC
eukprot:scaffold18819_cov34-Prasinocladus_malaysianus.AAC.1